MLQTTIGQPAAISPAKALAAYDQAVAGGCTFEQAAHMLACALRKPKRSAAVDINAAVKIGRKAKHWGEFIVTWADGSDTLVRGVIYDRPQDKWAAAFQAADRLRRQRARHAAWVEIGAPPRWTTGPNRVEIQTPAYEEYVRTRPLPAAVSILADDGETFSL